MGKEPTDVEVTEQTAELHPKSPARRHDRWLLLIGGFKLVEAVFFLLIGVGAIHFLHRDLRDAVLQLATKLRRDPEGRLVGFVLNHIDVITAQRLRQIGVATFLYAGLRVAEGWGLVLEKVWAEYLTVGVTVSFLPLEMFEIVRRPDWFRVGIMVINLLVLAYLLWLLQRKKEKMESLS
jgi:uncharacterized membrane protein (DUF2068 family)